VSSTLAVPLERGDAPGTFVSAELSDFMTRGAAQHADQSWTAFLAEFRSDAAARGDAIDDLEHDHWQWERKFTATSRLLPYAFYRVEHAGDIQGLMLLQSDGHYCQIPGQKPSPLVYVMFLAVAPWNYGRLVKVPRYRGAGSVLLRAAVELSTELGFGGRIGLHSLPQSESWYEQYEMVGLGPDPKKSGLKYYEMTSDQARIFLREE
jgi:GNAT superfamily N-acetyltransferase